MIRFCKGIHKVNHAVRCLFFQEGYRANVDIELGNKPLILYLIGSIWIWSILFEILSVLFLETHATTCEVCLQCFDLLACEAYSV